MRELVILSGKGGTGKTSLTAAFAAFAENAILCDADVDAADLHLLMAPQIKQKPISRAVGSRSSIRKNAASVVCALSFAGLMRLKTILR
jgi:MinD superfamily P-loop ATPase